MERKSKKELLSLVEEQNQNLQKYKSRLHDVVESYKNILKEKETLECSVRILTEASSLPLEEKSGENESEDNIEVSEKSKNKDYIEQLRSSLGAMTIEKSRIENELRADRKNLLQQKEDIEKQLGEKESKWFSAEDKYKNQIIELRKKIGNQQREREKEQHDHVLMLKELQNVLANERAVKEKLEQQVGELLQRANNRISDKKALEYEKHIEDLQNKLTVTQDRLKASENEARRTAHAFQKYQEEMDEMKTQYIAKIDEEKRQADLTEENLKLLTFVKEKRISSLESRISELSAIVGDHDKLRQQDQLTIQKLKGRVSQLQLEHSTLPHNSCEGAKLWENNRMNLQEASDNMQSHVLTYTTNENLLRPEMETDITLENQHAHCQMEILRLKEELEQYKVKTESVLKERLSKTPAAVLSDAKAAKEIKELKKRITQLQSQLQTCQSQLKLNEEYHKRVTANLEKSSDDMKLLHKQEVAQIQLVSRTQLLELEQQIQKQRERTLALLEEKDKEIGQLKSSYLTPFLKKEKDPQDVALLDDTTEDQDTPNNLLSNSLISSKKEGHILHYIQELARKDVEISNLRHSRIQSESLLRKLQQSLAFMEDNYNSEAETLKSRIKLLESSQDKEGTNVEYLKNVVLRFLKCNDPNSRRHMINAIATVLHFTSSEVQDVKASIR